MNKIVFGRSVICKNGPPYVIAEIGHNHQGNLATAVKMIEAAAECGVQAVKFQKRDNPTLFTREYSRRPYDNENSFGATYGEHREHLEFGRREYLELMRVAEENSVELIVTPFDLNSVEFLESIGVSAYKISSGDLTNTPLLMTVAKLGKPIFVSAGAATLEEVRLAYETLRKDNDQICLLHCIAAYPAEYSELNLRFIETLKREFPDAILGYSGHDNGILAAVIAYMLGAVVIEKHFTLNHAWKGTDHKFSLEREGLRKQVRDLTRIDVALGTGEKKIQDSEKDARIKMGKSIYAAKALKAGATLCPADLVIRSPGIGLPPYRLNEVLGRTLVKDLAEEEPVGLEFLK